MERSDTFPPELVLCLAHIGVTPGERENVDGTSKPCWSFTSPYGHPNGFSTVDIHSNIGKALKLVCEMPAEDLPLYLLSVQNRNRAWLTVEALVKARLEGRLP